MKAAPLPQVRVGLPYLTHEADHPFLHAVRALGAPVLISMGSLYREAEGGFRRLPLTAWTVGAALDSAGFVAMARFGGYRWTVADYVEQVVLNFPGDDEEDGDDDPVRCALPSPMEWWSAPDYCCEKQIAGNRAEVERRIALTVEGYQDARELLEAWRREGENQARDPMPILQGRLPADYVRCAEQLAAAADAVDPCTCPTDPEACGATWHRERTGLPELVGVGSVCTRPVGGPEGLLPVLEALDEALPAHVRLHLFGVKGEALSKLGRLAGRVQSIDSMAWDKAASWEADKLSRAAGERVSCTLDMRVKHLQRWHAAQAERLRRLAASPRPVQRRLFG